MRSHRRTASGFSLVELVVVIVIIGIIAAIAVPRISRGAKGASDSAIGYSLASMRAAIDLYAVEHHDVFPGKKTDAGEDGGLATDFVAQLTQFSSPEGVCAAAKDEDAKIIYGPYLRHGIPPLPVGKNAGSTGVLFDGNSPPQVNEGDVDNPVSDGWVYNPDTGEIVANTSALDDKGTAYSSY